MKYCDGNVVKIGDLVEFNCRCDRGTVVLIIETLEEMKAFGVSKPQLLIKAPKFGHVAANADSFADNGMLLIERQKDSKPLPPQP
jgi:hypothetical protein